MGHLHQYTPFVENIEDFAIPSLNTPRAKISGDQLTAARAQGAKKAKLNADAPTSRLQGLVPVSEDWHTKVNFLEVGLSKFAFFEVGIPMQSLQWIFPLSGDMETLLFARICRRTWHSLQLRNKMNHTNVLAKPLKHFNACEDFFDLVISCHIITAALAVLKMKSLSDRPSED